jgi:hypothetical protein
MRTMYWIGMVLLLSACDDSTTAVTEPVGDGGTGETVSSTSDASEDGSSKRQVLEASGDPWRPYTSGGNEKDWRGGTGWATEEEGQNDSLRENLGGSQFSWEVYGEIAVEEGLVARGGSGFHFRRGAPGGGQVTVCTLSFEWGPTPVTAPVCEMCESVLTMEIVGSEEKGSLCDELEFNGDDFLGETAHLGIPKGGSDQFYWYDDGALEEGEDPWILFEGYGAFQGDSFHMEGLVEL